MDALRTIASNSVDCIITDPPYGIDYQGKGKRFAKIANDKLPFIWWMHDAFRVLKDRRCIVVFTRWDVEESFRQALRIAGFHVKSQVIWDKAVHGIGDCLGAFGSRHENIIFAVKGRFTFPDKRPMTVIRVPKINPTKLVHPNEKPEELINYLIDHLTSPGQLILDPFLGSGVTALAAKKLGRNYLGVELDEGYIRVIKARLQAAEEPVR
jgi:DNA modification methylase